MTQKKGGREKEGKDRRREKNMEKKPMVRDEQEGRTTTVKNRKIIAGSLIRGEKRMSLK